MQHEPSPVPRDARADGFAVDLDATRLPPGDWPGRGTVPVSVLVPTWREQANIAECLRHVQWARELVVVDSRSPDLTVPLAQAFGATVYHFMLGAEGWPKKRNWALEHVPWAHRWVLIVDADEHITPELAREIAAAVRDDADAEVTGYWLNRRFMFLGRWIRHCGYYPSWNLRLFQHRLGRYERIAATGDTDSGDNEVHEHVILREGRAGWLRSDFLHYAYPDLSTWVEKHNRYSSWEAHAMDARMAGEIEASLFAGPIARRRWLKRMVRRLPLRPTLRFIYHYFLRGGFLDGYPGYVLCRLLAWYEFISLAKHRELKRSRKVRGKSDDLDKAGRK